MTMVQLVMVIGEHAVVTVEWNVGVFFHFLVIVPYQFDVKIVFSTHLLVVGSEWRRWEGR